MLLAAPPHVFNTFSASSTGTTADANVLVKKLREADGLSYGNSVFKVEFGDAHRAKLFPRQQGPFGARYHPPVEDFDPMRRCGASALMRVRSFSAGFCRARVQIHPGGRG